MRLALLTLLAFSASGCDTSAGESTPVTLFDDAGPIRATGRLTFDEPLAVGARVEGTFELSAPGTGVTTEPTGPLVATCTPDAGGARLVVILEPQISDGGLDLGGRCDDGQLEGGDWSLGSLAGPVRQGTFEFARSNY